MNKNRCLLLLIPLALLASCASVQVDYVDANLKPETLRSKSVAIASVTGTDRQTGKTIASSARKILAKKRRDLKVGQSSPIILTSSSSSLSSAKMSELKRAGNAFAILIQITSDNTSNDVTRSSSTDTEYSYDSEGNVIACWTETEYTTSAVSRRRVSACFHLYDLSTKKRVWQTSGSHGESNSRSNCSSFSYPRAPAFPPPPSTPDVMENIIAAAFKKLPKERFKLFGND